jgi:large subunit GTPase 1
VHGKGIDDRSMWADHFEKQNITYAFFSAADAAAAQEQAERMWRRENDIESESEDEDEDVEGEHSGSEGEAGSEDDDEEEEDEVEDELSKKVQGTTLDSDYEEGWSTEEEDDEAAENAETALDKKVENGDKIPMKDVVAAINHWEIKEEKPVTEDKRTRVLSVTELENLFVNAAPELHRKSPCYGIY